jgi:hypothetical protein
MSEKKFIRKEKIEAELKLTLEKACELLSTPTKKITPKTHWVRVTHELTRDALPWAVATLQAISRGVEEEPQDLAPSR